MAKVIHSKGEISNWSSPEDHDWHNPSWMAQAELRAWVDRLDICLCLSHVAFLSNYFGYLFISLNPNDAVWDSLSFLTPSSSLVSIWGQGFCAPHLCTLQVAGRRSVPQNRNKRLCFNSSEKEKTWMLLWWWQVPCQDIRWSRVIQVHQHHILCWLNSL